MCTPGFLMSANQVAERVPLSVDELGGPAGGRLVEVDVCDLFGPSVANGVQQHCFHVVAVVDCVGGCS